MRSLPWDDQSMVAVVCADNALPHLLTDDDALAALREAHRVLRPGGPIAVTTRDYNAVLAERPTTTPLQVMVDDEGARTITFQLWTWRDTSDVYDLEHFQVAESQDWATVRRSATYRAYTADHLRRLAQAAGFEDARWYTPSQAGFFQPVLTAVAG